MTELHTPATPDAMAEDGDTDVTLVAPVPTWKKALRITGWTLLALVCMVFFTLWKLPEDRVRNFIQGNLTAALSAQNIGFTAGQGKLSILWGASYTMKDVVLSFPPPAEPVKIEQITVTPAILPMLTGKMGGRVRLENAGGSLIADFSMKKNDVSLSYDAKDLDLGKLGVLAATAGVKANAVLSGSGNFSGDLNAPATFAGHLGAELSRVVLDAQSVMGFSIPKITVSEGKVDLAIDKGKATVKTLRLGRPGNAADDLHANVTGDATLNRNLMQSMLNLKVGFSVSQNIMKSFVLLDALLGAGRQPDGSYLFTINGPLYGPNAMPVPAGAK